MKKILALLLIYTQLIPGTAWSSGRIQNEDVKSLTELTNAGGTSAQLINDSKIYVTANGINSQLSTAISSGLIGSGGSKNFILNGAIETGTTGYASFKDAAGVLPVDGTGGSPTHITLSRTTSSPLAGSGSLLISNSGSSSAQGEGVSYDFTIDNGQQGKVQTISADYQKVSGTFQAGVIQGQDSDIEMYAYDVTNGVVIQPSNFKLYCASTTVTCTYTGSFQAAINSTSYRLIFFVPTTNTSAWAVKFDSISVGPTAPPSSSSAVAFRAEMNSDQSIATSSFTTVSNLGTVVFDTAGGFNGSDTYKIPVAGIYRVGAGVNFGASNARFIIKLQKNGSDVNRPFDATMPSGGNVTVSGSALIQCKAGDLLTVQAFQTSGTINLTSGQQTYLEASLVSASTGASVSGSSVAANYKTPTGTLTNSANLITFTSKISDTTNSYSSGGFTVPVSGLYDISAAFTVSATFVAGNQTELLVKINGSNAYQTIINSGGASGLESPRVSVNAVYLTAGDLVEIYSYTDGTGPSYFTGGNSWFSIILNNSASSAPSSGTSVAATYTITGGNVGNNNTTTVIPWDTKLLDTTGSMNSSTGVFTCPVSGNYYVSGGIETDTATSEGLQRVFVRKNGSNFGNHFQTIPTDAQTVTTNFGILVPCNAGDTLDVTLHYTQGGTYTGTGNVSIVKM